MQEGRFREDLFYRLNVITIDVPPLRERRDDIAALLDHYIALCAREHGRTIVGLEEPARRILTAHPWPGNIRELRNMVESLVVTARGSLIRAEDLPVTLKPAPGTPAFSLPMGCPLEEVEREYVLRTLRMVGGNKTKAARVLGIGKKTLYRRLERYFGGSSSIA
jgi:DNA-binding NtrC family response regulator